MGCRPAKFSKVTDSIVTYSNGIKITSGKENTNQTNDNSNLNGDKDSKNGGNEESNNEKNSMITNNRKESRTARRANRKIGAAKVISPIFRNVPSVVLERSKSQIEFFLKLEEKINNGQKKDKKEDKKEEMELESI